MSMKTLADLYINTAKKFPNVNGFNSKDKKGKDGVYQPTTYKKLLEYGEDLGCALIDLGLKPGDHVGAIADNRLEWIIADCAVQLNGAANVPRGSDSTEQDVEYILGHADCKITFCEDDKQLEKIQNTASKTGVEKIIVMDKAFKKGDGEKVFALWDLVEKGKGLRSEHLEELKKRTAATKEDDLFTIIYTSGTTGLPKGVMLAHRNIMFQLEKLPKLLKFEDGERFLSILPVWHIFERALEYAGIYIGGKLYYTNVRDLKNDMTTVKPTFMGSAPRLWEKIYDGIQEKINSSPKARQIVFRTAYNILKAQRSSQAYLKGNVLQREPEVPGVKLLRSLGSAATSVALAPAAVTLDEVIMKKIREAFGGELKGTISGGGALPSHVDEFFSTIGLTVLEGYGMTETSPVISCRTYDAPILGTVGPIFLDTRVKLLDDQGREVPQGERGVIHVKGPQVMKGYYKRPEETEKVLKDGWMNTGDIGFISANGTLTITGRAKDTVVLLGGENVEPVPIENRILESAYVDQVVVVGQDHKTLGALVWPNLEKLGVSESQVKNLKPHSDEWNIIHKEMKRLVNAESGFKSFERVTNFRFLPKPMEVGDELTNLFKMKRNIISDKYDKLIGEMA